MNNRIYYQKIFRQEIIRMFKKTSSELRSHKRKSKIRKIYGG